MDIEKLAEALAKRETVPVPMSVLVSYTKVYAAARIMATGRDFPEVHEARLAIWLHFGAIGEGEYAEGMKRVAKLRPPAPPANATPTIPQPEEA